MSNQNVKFVKNKPLYNSDSQTRAAEMFLLKLRKFYFQSKYVITSLKEYFPPVNCNKAWIRSPVNLELETVYWIQMLNP